MKTKTIWMWAILLGALATMLFYMTILHPKQTATPVMKPVETVKKVEQETNELSISAGKRAISIPVTDVQGISGFIQTGDMVDVIMVSPQQWAPPSGALFLQKVKILATGNTVKPVDTKAKEYKMVTLEVSPEDGVSLAIAVQKGASLYLMLHAPKDTSTVPAVQKSLDTILNGGAAK